MSSTTAMENMVIDLMKIDSTTGKEGEIAEFVAQILETDGWKVQRQPLLENKTRFNVLATRGDKSPRLILNTHLDTVPPHIPPTQDEKNIYGRGANETKGQIACIISAANQLVSTNPSIGDQIGLLFVVGEEIDHIGMKRANDFGLSPEYLIVGEPTELKFTTLQKGALKVLLRTRGIAGHSGYPDSGESAIHKIVPVLNDIINYQWPSDKTVGDTTFNIGLINGGQAQNAWAEQATANVFFRVTTSVDDVMTQLKKIVGDRASIEHLSSNSPVTLSEAPLDLPVDQIAFNTDMAYYGKLDELKGKFIFGGGSIKNAFSDHEFMPKQELKQCRDILVELATKLLQ